MAGTCFSLTCLMRDCPAPCLHPLPVPPIYRYFMSKADAVEKEHDRQRVLIQITQNLATRIRNSHAFNLPT